MKRRIFNVGSLLLLSTLLGCAAPGNGALFDNCDHEYNLNAGYSYLESPYYPNSYPSGTSCRYRFVAPLDHNIEANCTINLVKNGNSCSTEFFYVATDGDRLLRGSEQLCGSGIFSRHSLFRELVLAYASYGAQGVFRCQLYVAPQACDCGWSMNTRIVNGQETSPHEHPHMVALRDISTNTALFCGGTIVSHYFILTAAHCANVQLDPAKIIARVGDHDLSNATESQYAAEYGIAQIIVHSGYTEDPITNDIALLRVTSPINWSRGVAPICLPPFANAYDTFVYNYVDVLGWGTTSFGGPIANKLQQVSLMVVGNAACEQSYNGIAPISSSQLCTYDYTGNSKDSCQYDSGGPVILRTTRLFLVGCISFGKVCGQDGYAMGVNTRITSYLSWIHQITAYTTCPVSM